MKFARGCFVVAGFLVFGSTVAEGCGDLLVSFGRGVRYQRAYRASRQATIAVFWNNRESGSVLTNSKLQSAMREVGHRVVFVQDSTQLGVALKAGKVDVVLADFSDAASIAPEVESASSKPVIVPVLYKPSNADMAAARKQYPFPLKASSDEMQFLTAIDDAMKLRAKTGGKS
jgi:hypothetical protein